MTFLRCVRRRCWLVLPAALLCAGAAVAGPNVLFILADDLGWGDPSCYGNGRFKTPALDRLARGGTLFTQFYQTGSVCSPSRASLLTGRWPADLRAYGFDEARWVDVRGDLAGKAASLWDVKERPHASAKASPPRSAARPDLPAHRAPLLGMEVSGLQPPLEP
jgi:hypothetical protein